MHRIQESRKFTSKSTENAVDLSKNEIKVYIAVSCKTKFYQTV